MAAQDLREGADAEDNVLTPEVYGAYGFMAAAKWNENVGTNYTTLELGTRLSSLLSRVCELGEGISVVVGEFYAQNRGDHTYFGRYYGLKSVDSDLVSFDYPSGPGASVLDDGKSIGIMLDEICLTELMEAGHNAEVQTGRVPWKQLALR